MMKVNAVTAGQETATSSPPARRPASSAPQSLHALTDYPLTSSRLLEREGTDSAQFLAELRGHVVAAVEQELVGTDWSAEHCPWIDYWFSYYGNRSRDDVERALRRYAPAARDALSVADYVPAVVAQVRAGVARWRETGQIDSPAGFDIDRGANGERIGDSAQFAVNALDDGRALTGLPPAITSTLGDSFGDVQLHTGPTAARLAERVDALAFAVGNHVVLGANAPRPGTLEGDGLLAHELAHVQQQRSAGPAATLDAGDSPAREANADAAVAQAVSAHLGFANLARGAWSAISAPLSLSRCKDKNKDAIKELKQRKAELDQTYATAGVNEFSKLAATDAERTAVEHWLAVREKGRGTTTGSTSGETGLPKCNCTTYVADVLQRTYEKQGRGARWEAIYKKALSLNTGTLTGLNGLQLQSALMSERGWKAVYFAPDPTYQHYRRRIRISGRVARDAAGNEMWKRDTEAADTWAQVSRGKRYRGMFKVHHTVINYRPEAALPNGWTPVQSTTVKDTSGLDKLAKIPFGVLTVRGAYHMAVLIHGVVYEAHLDAKSTELHLYESKPLVDWGWNEGVVVAPGDEVDKAFGTP